MPRLSGRIDLAWTLLAPLSHIGESAGPDSYLATQYVLDPNGQPVEVFTYSGNAVRGMLRDAGARYLQDHLSPGAIVQVPIEVFYALWSGGSLGEGSRLDIDQAREIRKVVPHLSVFGCAVGNQMLPGKINVSDVLPLAQETQHLIPDRLRNPEAVTWRAMTGERSYSRQDDAKDEIKRAYLFLPEAAEVPELEAPEPSKEADQGALFGDAPAVEPEKPAEKPKAKNPRERPQSMRYTVEVLQPGARMWSEIVFFDMSDVELGALVACFDQWSNRPVIGGKSSVGMGQVRLDARLWVRDQKDEDFATVDGRLCLFGQTARKAKKAYDDYLRRYAEHLEKNSEGMVKLLHGA